MIVDNLLIVLVIAVGGIVALAILMLMTYMLAHFMVFLCMKIFERGEKNGVENG